MKFFLSVFLIWGALCLPQNSFAASETFQKLSPEDQKRLRDQVEKVYSSVASAVNEAKSGSWDKSKNLFVLCMDEAGVLLPHFEGSGQLFDFGLGLGGAVTKLCGPDHELAAKILEKFTVVAQEKHYLEIQQGMQMVLLQKYYHLQKWDKGSQLISQTVTGSGSVYSKLFIREAAGFSSGLASMGGRPKEAIQIYSSLFDDPQRIGDKTLNFGDALMNLAQLFAADTNYTGQLKVFERIQKEQPGYYQTNLATISYFRYGAYLYLHDAENAMKQLSVAAKSGQEHPDWVTDEVIRDDLPDAIKKYQGVGVIDKSFNFVLPKKPGAIIGEAGSLRRKMVLAAFLLITISFAIILIKACPRTNQ